MVCKVSLTISTKYGASTLLEFQTARLAKIFDEVLVSDFEEAPVGELFKEPLHPYTQGLLRSIPRIDLAATQKQRLEAIPGTVPTLRGDIKPGCRFAPRCALAKPMHFENTPPLKEVRPGHKVACFLY